jgi:hypothetical protein
MQRPSCWSHLVLRITRARSEASFADRVGHRKHRTKLVELRLHSVAQLSKNAQHFFRRAHR